MSKQQMTIKELAERCADAYSTDRYRNGWAGCVRMLRQRGYADPAIEAIIRSKWTRWAGDMAGKDSGCTSTDLARFLDTMTPAKRAQGVVELVFETFHADGSVIEPRWT